MPKKTLRTRYSSQQKAEIVLEVLKEEQTLTQISSKHQVHVNQLRRWRAQVVEHLPQVFEPDQTAVRDLETRHAEEKETLYAEIGRLTTELGWLKKKGSQRL